MLKQFRLLLLVCIVLFAALLSAIGCSSLFSGKKEKEPPFEMPTYETADGKPKLVSDCTFIGNYNIARVHGFGLVVDLPGTGGEDANTEHYQQVLNEMIRQKVPNARALLASPQTAVVELLAYIPPGMQAGERFDVEVRLPTSPQESSTISLRGGRLMVTNLSEMMGVQGHIASGNTLAKVEGPILVDDLLATETSNPKGLKNGIILGGAVAKDTRPLYLILKKDSQSVFVAERIERSINQRFYFSFSQSADAATRMAAYNTPRAPMGSTPIHQRATGSHRGVASAKTDEGIILDVHPTYANDVSRYVRVIQSIACAETPAQQRGRIERLQEELFDPDTSQHAAFQLEAIGKAGIEALRQALKSPSREVRFHAATSLAYLGDGTPAKVLAEIALAEPAFRVYALNALGVMKNDLEAETHLRELLHIPCSETRYGAFRALKMRNPWDQTIRGEMLGGQFSYHGISSQSMPMVHVTKKKYPEVVLFGTDIVLKQPFALEAGPQIFVNGQTPGTVVVTRLMTSGLDERRTVSNRLDEIIRAVVDLKGTYPDVLQLLQQADMQRVLPCPLEIDRLPEPNRVYRRQGSDDSEWVATEEEKPKSFWERMNPKNLFAPNPSKESPGSAGTVNTSSRD